MTRVFKSGLLAAALLLPALAVPAHAQTCIFGIICFGGGGSGAGGGSSTPDAPEISPAMLTSGIAIVGGAAMMIRGRRKKNS